MAQTNGESASTSAKKVLGALSILGISTFAGYAFYKYQQQQNEWKKKWKGRDIIAIGDLNRRDFEELFFVASYMRSIVSNNKHCNIASNKILGCIFYEPSTRTSSSFRAAMLRLGGKVISINDLYNTSSVKKGETLSDTIKCLQCYCDIIALRHSDNNASKEALLACKIEIKSKSKLKLNSVWNKKDFNKTVILNAGNGSKEHPTQALLDLYTIYQTRKLQLHNKLNPLNDTSIMDYITVTFLGDLKYGRTVHSLAVALMRFKNIKINFVAPKSLQIPSYVVDLMESIREQNDNHSELTGIVDIEIFSELNKDIMTTTDVLYVTRIQKERLENPSDYDKLKNSYIIDNNLLNEKYKCKKTMIIMHPLPRVNEIATEVDNDPRAIYFKQMEYGMYLRMALLALTLGVY